MAPWDGEPVPRLRSNKLVEHVPDCAFDPVPDLPRRGRLLDPELQEFYVTKGLIQKAAPVEDLYSNAFIN